MNLTREERSLGLWLQLVVIAGRERQWDRDHGAYYFDDFRLE